MAYIKVKGKTYGIHTGSRGGRYWVDELGKKHYLKPTSKTAKKSVEKAAPEPTLKRYIGFFYELDDEGCRVDDFKEWTDAYSKEEARRIFEDDHWHSICDGRIELDDIWEE